MEMYDNLPLPGTQPGIRLVCPSRLVINDATQMLRVRANSVNIPVVGMIMSGHAKTSEATAGEAEATTRITTTDASAEMSVTAVDRIAIRSVEAGAEALTETALLMEGETVHQALRMEIPRPTTTKVTDPLFGIGTLMTSQELWEEPSLWPWDSPKAHHQISGKDSETFVTWTNGISISRDPGTRPRELPVKGLIS